MHLGLPQLIVLILYTLSVGISIAQHGKPKKGNENALTSIIAAGIAIGLLYWGGFFK